MRTIADSDEYTPVETPTGKIRKLEEQLWHEHRRANLVSRAWSFIACVAMLEAVLLVWLAIKWTTTCR
jgi:hypothetical protein